jgi:hypothetical protein
LDKELITVLNILYLLKNKPMTFNDLFKTGCFRNKTRLSNGLETLHRADCIEKIEAAKIWVILGYGFSVLSLYPGWTPLPAEILEIVEPIGRSSNASF